MKVSYIVRIFEMICFKISNYNTLDKRTFLSRYMIVYWSMYSSIYTCIHLMYNMEYNVLNIIFRIIIIDKKGLKNQNLPYNGKKWNTTLQKWSSATVQILQSIKTD